ncbi:MAG: UDP-N-acetylmuramoyl-L-alanyl-D-glutamate--2,6-diaminopimelate ligase [Lentisphaerae bacterium]|nr:UDP-N-acetylmuramoyl-L-alanyl-D-glutamate--2,6-diaminopimelate ligase [Lentisphaerota bacterium]
MKLDALLKDAAVTAVDGPRNAAVNGIACDSRQVRPGYLFAALPGAHVDGWSYAEDAVKRGAAAVVTESTAPAHLPVSVVRVADARAAVARLAAAFHGYPSRELHMTGITGTNGKTTVAYMIRDVLRADGRRPGLLTTVEYAVGRREIPAARTTPEAPELQGLLAQMTAAGCACAVMEVSSHALVQKRTEGVDFDCAVFTNLTRDHLDYHGTMEAYFEAKSLLFRGLGRGAKGAAAAVMHTDHEWGRRLAAVPWLRADRLTYGLEAGADVRAEDVRLSSEGSAFRVVSPWGATPAHIRLLGRFNLCNALAAFAVCGSLGVAPELTAAALSEMKRVPGRLEPVETGRPFQVFVDYAHTDDALEHVLTTLREITPNRLLVVFGCGGDRDRSKRPIMGRVAERLADVSIVTSDNPRSENPAAIIDAIRAGFTDAGRCEAIADRRAAIERALTLAEAGDAVLVAGKGHETFQECANKTVPFDDRQIVTAWAKR